MTPQERRLWYEGLRRFAFHFYRQKQIGNYIVDFYCPAVKLAVELDGSQHYTEEGLAYDRNRTSYLEQLGITVLRVSNRDIDEHFNYVYDVIDHAIQEIMDRRSAEENRDSPFPKKEDLK